jgi:hypothetical protein
MIPDTSLGWMAGVLDFHGAIISKGSRHRAEGSEQVTLTVTTTRQPEVIARLCELTGIRYGERETPPFSPAVLNRKGCAEHCPDAHIHALAPPVLRDTASWSVSGASLAVVLWNLRHHLVTTVQPWESTLLHCLAVAKLRGRGSAAALAGLRRLGGLGWEIPPVFTLMMNSAEEEKQTA